MTPMRSAADESGFIDDDALALDLAQLGRACGCDAQLIVALVREGAVEAVGGEPSAWRFSGATLQRARVAVRLARDLEINPPGVALALDLLDELRALRSGWPR